MQTDLNKIFLFVYAKLQIQTIFAVETSRFARIPLPPSGREGDRRLTTVEGERDCVFSELEVKLWTEGDGVCFPQKITLIY